MGLVISGIAKGFSGNVGNLTFSQQEDGTTTVRSRPGKSSKPPTVLQLSTRQDVSVCSQFLKSVKDFLEIGFRLEAKFKGGNQYNAAASFTRKQAITGEYPDRRIDYSKVLFTKGEMPAVQNAKVSLDERGFSFTWDPEAHLDGTHFSDQVMLMAYFPELNKAVYMTAGAQRFRGNDLLMLSGMKRGYVAEVYISFIQDNHKNISNSTHLGQLNW